MKTKKIVIIVLLAVTAAIAAIHLGVRKQVPEGALQVNSGDETFYVEIEKLPIEKVHGVIVNGKGEEIEIDAEGISLRDILSDLGIDVEGIVSVKVTAGDEFSAELTGKEVRESGKAYLYQEGQQSVTLVVFGDSNAKRNVRGVERIDVQ